MADQMVLPKNRWLVTSRDVLERIEADRELEKEKLRRALPRDRLPPQAQALPSQPNLPTYINILEDKDAANLTVVKKDVWGMGATQPFPMALAGLRLPKCENKDIRRFIIYTMSQTMARRYGLKIKPRRRQSRKKKNQVEVMEVGDSDTQLDPDYSSPMDVDEEHFGEPLLHSTLIGVNGVSGEMPLEESRAPVAEPFREWSAYCQNKVLPTNQFLHNDESRGRFPTSSTLYPVLNEILELGSEKELAGEKLRSSILKFAVHRVPETADMTNMHLFQTLDVLGAGGKFDDMDNILGQIVKFHLKIHNLYGLIKGCTPKWQSKSKVPVLQKPKTTVLDVSTMSHPSQAEKKARLKEVIASKLSANVPQKAVIQGLSAILRASGCSKLLGSNYNGRKFLKFLNKFLLAGTVCTLKINQLMSFLQCGHCRWLDSISDPTMRTHIFAKTISWIFSDYVLSILKTGFHVTEVEGRRLQLNFYFHNNWRSVTDIVRNRLIRKGNMKKIHTLGKQALPPTATIRFIPKRDDLRPIVRVGLRRKISVRDLSDIKLLLNYLAVSIAPHARGINELFIRNAWKKFLIERKEHGKQDSKLYYLRFDIRNAYPSVDTDKLQSILRQIVDVRKSFVVKDTYVGRVKRRKTSTLALKEESRGARINGETAFNVEAVLTNLLNIIRSSEIVKIGNSSFHFSYGLPQGSPISQLLSNIYYGDMDRVYLSEFLNQAGEFFCRCVDDYFFVSTDPNRVAALLQRMRDGIPDYRCYVKNSKTKTNVISSDLETNDEEWVLFCGWRFSLTTGHVARDFASYAGLDACATLTFSMASSSSTEDFISKRMGILKPLRLSYLVLDPSFNCKWRIATSVYEGALMMAFRFYALCRVLYPTMNSLNNPGIATQLCNAISAFANDVFSIVRRHVFTFSPIQESRCRCTSHGPEATNALNVTVTSFDSFEIRYIVYKAFMMKLTSHLRRPYVGLLAKLETLIQDSSSSLRRRDYQYLLPLIGNTMPQYFKDMKR